MPNSRRNSQRTMVFVSYSHDDKEALEQLQKFIKPLERVGLVKLWADTEIPIGSHWEQEIEQALAEAKVALFLVSASFLASDFINNKELPRLLSASKDEGLTILQFFLSHCYYESTPLANYQAVNSPDKPLCDFPENEHSKEWKKLCEVINFTLSQINQSPSKSPVREENRNLIAGREFIDVGNKQLLSLRLSGNFDKADTLEIYQILSRLQEIIRDESITIEKVIRGSIQLILNGSLEALERINLLFDSGELIEILGDPIEEVHFLSISELSSLIKENGGVALNLFSINLRRADLSEADLRRADLRRADLFGANLHGANLLEANLFEANLRGANLRGASLLRADLHEADLRGTNLRGVDLRGANLHGANLMRADLTNIAKAFRGTPYRGRAVLRKSNLSEANLNEADLSGADLSGADLIGAQVYNTRFVDALGFSYQERRDLIARGAIFEDSPHSPDRVNIPV